MTDAAASAPTPRNPILPLRLPTLAAVGAQPAALAAHRRRRRRPVRIADLPRLRSRCNIRRAMPARNCLSVRLDLAAESTGAANLISDTLLHHCNELYYRERVPLRLGLVRLDEGITVLAHLHGDCPVADATRAVRVRAHLDKAGQAALIALPQATRPTWPTTGCCAR